jgi:MFS family permease
MTQAIDVRPQKTASADFLGGLSLAGLGFAIAGLGACVTLLARDLGESTDQLAVLPSAFAVGLLIVAAAGSILLRTDAKLPVLRVGAIVCAGGAVLLALAPNLVVALAGGLFVGLGGALMILVVPLMLSGPRAAHRIARANAIASTTAIFAPLIIGTLDSVGPTGRLAMLLVAVPLVLLLPFTRRAAPAQVAEKPQDNVIAGGAADLSLTTAKPTRGPWGSVFGGWSRLVLAVSVEFCFVIWAVARMLATGVPAGTAALLASAFPIGMAVGRVIGPLKVRRISPLLPGTALAAAGTILVTAFNGQAVVTVGLGLAGLGVSTLYPIVLADLLSIPGVSPAHLSSLSACASGVAILLAPAALAALASVVELRIAYLIPLPLLVILLFVRQPRQAETVSP